MVMLCTDAATDKFQVLCCIETETNDTTKSSRGVAFSSPPPPPSLPSASPLWWLK